MKTLNSAAEFLRENGRDDLTSLPSKSLKRICKTIKVKVVNVKKEHICRIVSVKTDDSQ